MLDYLVLIDAEKSRFLYAVPSLCSVVASESRLAPVVVEAVDTALAVPAISNAG